MPDDRHALSKIPQALPMEADYEAICTAVMSTGRGRWFLEEYARRSRQSDTMQLLAAIERIEAAIADDRAHRASQSIRIDLLEMARAIARTRAAVAGVAQPAPAQPGVAAAAERLRDIAWSMRACGIELSTSEQIEELAQTILAASALHDPADHRAQELSEVLQYLEQRIDRMLGSHALALPEDSVQQPAVADEAMDDPAFAEAARMAAPDETPAAGTVAVLDEAPALDMPEPAGEAASDSVIESPPASPSETPTTIETIADEPATNSPPSTEADAGEPALVAEEPQADLAPAGQPPEDTAAEQLATASSTEEIKPHAPPTEPALAPGLESQSEVARESAVAKGEPETEFQSEAPAEVQAQSEPQPELQAQAEDQVEPELAACAEAEPEAIAKGDPIASQVDQDLDALGPMSPPAAAEPPQSPAGKTAAAAAREAVPSMWDPSSRAPAQRDDDPADFLLEPWSGGTPAPRAEPDMRGVSFAAIEKALFDGTTGAITPPAKVPAGATSAPQPHGTTLPRRAAPDPLAALAAMSDEERIALFT
jgi:hypothetical protein